MTLLQFIDILARVLWAFLGIAFVFGMVACAVDLYIKRRARLAREEESGGWWDGT